MKQLLATTLLLAVVGIVGCGDAKKPAPKTEPAKTTEAPKADPAKAP